MTQQAPQEKTIFTTEIAVLWGDLDLYNHVNNVAYFRYLEESRMRWLLQNNLVDMSFDALPVLVTAGVTFIKPVFYPATLQVSLEITVVGARSVSMQHRIHDANNLDTLHAEGHGKLVWINPKTGKSVPLPQRVLDVVALQ